MPDNHDADLIRLYEDRYSSLIALAAYSGESDSDLVEASQEIDLPEYFAPEPVPSTFTLVR